MKPNTILISLALVAGSAMSARAQVATAGAKACSTAEAVGYLGISGIDCNCTISRPSSEQEWRFRTEPRITSLEMDSKAGALLKINDIITAVNGKLITTREGAEELKSIKPGEAVILTVRRNGAEQRIAITAESACPDDSRLFSIYAPGRVYSGYAGVAPRALPAPVPGRYREAVPAVAYAWSEPRATFGMGLSCSNCAMAFSEKDHTAHMSFSRPPEVYSIERGGPADAAGIRRGDVITHVNGKAIDTDEGGKIFGNAKAGEKVKFTVRRNNETKTYEVKAAARKLPAAALAPAAGVNGTPPAYRYRGQNEQLLRRSYEEVSRRLGTLRYTGSLGNADIEVRGAPASVTETPDEIVITTAGSVVRISKKK